jgi:hypothetical protein
MFHLAKEKNRIEDFVKKKKKAYIEISWWYPSDFHYFFSTHFNRTLERIVE